MQIENLDHLGLVAGLIDELGLVDLTDEVIEPHCLDHVSSGQVVKAMILNALGFLSAPLYLFSEFFESKAVSHLLGERGRTAPRSGERTDADSTLSRLFERSSTGFETVFDDPGVCRRRWGTVVVAGGQWFRTRCRIFYH